MIGLVHKDPTLGLCWWIIPRQMWYILNTAETREIEEQIRKEKQRETSQSCLQVPYLIVNMSIELGGENGNEGLTLPRSIWRPNIRMKRPIICFARYGKFKSYLHYTSKTNVSSFLLLSFFLMLSFFLFYYYFLFLGCSEVVYLKGRIWLYLLTTWTLSSFLTRDDGICSFKIGCHTSLA